MIKMTSINKIEFQNSSYFSSLSLSNSEEKDIITVSKNHYNKERYLEWNGLTSTFNKSVQSASLLKNILTLNFKEPDQSSIDLSKVLVYLSLSEEELSLLNVGLKKIFDDQFYIAEYMD